MSEQLVWAVPLLVLAAGFAKPRWALLVLAASLPLFGSPPGGPYLAALDVAALAAIAHGFRSPRPPRSPLDLPVLASVAVGAVTLLPIAYRPPSWQPSILLALVQSLPGVPSWTILYTWRALANLLLGWALYRAVRRAYAGRSLVPLGRALGAGLAFVLVLGLAEHAGLVDLSFYRAIGGELYATRLHSLFFHSGWLAEYIVMASPLAIAALLAGGGRARSAGLTLAVLALATLIFTQQRGAWFAVIAQIGLGAVLAGPRLAGDRRLLRQVGLAAAGLAALGILFFVLRPQIVAPVLARMGQASEDLSGRTHLWRTALVMFRERPVLGWGLGAYAPAYDLHLPRGSPGAWAYRDTAHNLYLHVAAERGLLGLAALALTLAVGAGIAWRAYRSGVPETRALALAGLLSLAGFAVNGLVQYMFYLKNVEWLFWIVLAFVSLLASPPGAPERRLPARALLLLAFLAAPLRALAFEPLEAAGNRSFGLHEMEPGGEGGIRWTDERAAHRIAWEGETLLVRLANGHPHPEKHAVRVILGVDGERRAEHWISPAWKDYPVKVGRPERSWLVLEIEARPSFRPFRALRGVEGFGPAADFRRLGVVVAGLRWAGK